MDIKGFIEGFKIGLGLMRFGLLGLGLEFGLFGVSLRFWTVKRFYLITGLFLTFDS